MARGRRLAGSLIGVAALLACSGEHQGPGAVTEHALDPGWERAPDAAQSAVRAENGLPDDSQVLFGDLHTHTTFSPDAFIMSLPMLGGSGVHPPADACDFARFCADLDFWSINDHAEGISPRHWSDTIDAITECNRVAGSGDTPDLVSFLGWEWSQVGPTPEEHYGHKNVVLLETDRTRVPARPIAAPRPQFRAMSFGPVATLALATLHFSERQRIFDYGYYTDALQAVPACDAGVDPRELPLDCHEVAPDPSTLHAKLDAWDTPSIVIPHGTSWGLMTPRGFSLERELAAGQHDPSRQRLFEIYSGHGSAEPYRDWAAEGPGEAAMCPVPTPDYLPCCWRAGEIIRERCERESGEDCDARAQTAQRHYLEAGASGFQTVPGAEVADWLDCDQCRDCFNPAFSHRPAGSAQAATAFASTDGPGGAERRYRFGFIGSSDTHDARPGNGFKEFARLENTEASPVRNGSGDDPVAESRPIDWAKIGTAGRRYMERAASYLYTGGLAAVHARGRDREAIWDAFERREVYGTSGDRILLWFDLMNSAEGPQPMGAWVQDFADTPRFRVAAAGAFEQRPGCPDPVHDALTPERLEALCLGECFHPGERRRRITRIEVVRIRASAGASPVETRVEDPWRVLPCEDAGDGCRVEFEDPEFTSAEGEVAYYVRAIQEPTPAVNAGGVRCTTDDAGDCLEVDPCYGDDRTSPEDDCLADNEERAWSSPIFVTPAAAPVSEATAALPRAAGLSAAMR
ncbi:MAG: DUF3604 domain-containing protein [Myxococcota bacterium]